MTDKCKYKFQDKYHFEGDAYCTLFDTKCKNLGFICDENCQVFEDNKEFYRRTKIAIELAEKLKAKEEECKKLKEEVNKKYSVSGFNVIFMNEHIHELQDQVLELTETIKKQNGEYDKLRQSYEHTSNSLHCFIKKSSELRYSNIAMKNKYRKELTKQRESLERFKSFLNELKELVIHCSKQDICTTCDYSEECNLGDEEIPTYDICKFILNKINQYQ